MKNQASIQQRQQLSNNNTKKTLSFSKAISILAFLTLVGSSCKIVEKINLPKIETKQDLLTQNEWLRSEKEDYKDNRETTLEYAEKLADEIELLKKEYILSNIVVKNSTLSYDISVQLEENTPKTTFKSTTISKHKTMTIPKSVQKFSIEKPTIS